MGEELIRLRERLATVEGERDEAKKEAADYKAIAAGWELVGGAE
jgi:hypothetical protein